MTRTKPNAKLRRCLPGLRACWPQIAASFEEWLEKRRPPEVLMRVAALISMGTQGASAVRVKAAEALAQLGIQESKP